MLRPGQAVALCVLALLCIGVVMVNSADMSVTAASSVPLVESEGNSSRLGSRPPTTPTTTPTAVGTTNPPEASIPPVSDGSGSTTTAPAARPESTGAAGVASAVHHDAVTFASVVTSRSTIYMGLALSALGIGYFFPVRSLADRLGRPLDPAGGINDRGSLMKLGVVTFALVGVIALAYAPVIGREINGAHRWLRLPVPGMGDALSVQPSEIAKWALVAVVAWYGATRAAFMHRFWSGLVPALFAVGLVAGFVVLEDLGTGILIGSSACVVLLAAGARFWHFAMFVPVILAGLVAAVVTNPYRINRLRSFVDPYQDPEGTGYHMIQSMLAVAGGEGTGRGLGHGLQKFGYLPEDRTDFLFAVICEELGIAGAALVIFLFVGLVWAGMSIVRRERHMFLKLMGLGLLCTIGLQALINLMVVTGLGPTKGIALPLVSSGGTGWILTAFSMGLLAAIDRTQPEYSVEPIDEPQAEPIADARVASA